MEVAENIYRLTQGVTNFHLIGESGKFTLVDAGTLGDWDFFRWSLGSLGQLPDLAAVLLTHAHPDRTVPARAGGPLGGPCVCGVCGGRCRQAPAPTHNRNECPGALLAVIGMWLWHKDHDAVSYSYDPLRAMMVAIA